jgi:hypothetical protein
MKKSVSSSAFPVPGVWELAGTRQKMGRLGDFGPAGAVDLSFSAFRL